MLQTDPQENVRLRLMVARARNGSIEMNSDQSNISRIR